MNTEQLKRDPMKETEQTLLDQIKDQVAKEWRWNSWNDFAFYELKDQFNCGKIINEICERYYQVKAKEINSAIGNLLAVMHGDGGHYQEKHGTLKAIEDAQELLYVKWKSLTQVKDSCEATLKKASEKADTICINPDINPEVERYQHVVDKSSITDPNNITIV